MVKILRQTEGVVQFNVLKGSVHKNCYFVTSDDTAGLCHVFLKSCRDFKQRLTSLSADNRLKYIRNVWASHQSRWFWTNQH